MKKLAVDVECASCHRKIPMRVEEMVPGRSRRCPSCGVTLKFTGDDGRKAQKALDDLERTLRNL